MAMRLAELERDESVRREALDRVVAEFGKYSWPYRHAWEEVYGQEGKQAEERRFLELLPAAVREHVQTDVSGGARGGVASEIVRLPIFEKNYTPEDRLIIEEALLRARREAGDQLGARLLAGELPEYEEVALRWKQERLKLEEQLLKLRNIAREKSNLAEEIQRVLADYDVGFSGLMGREPTLAELKGVVADYANRA